MSKKGGADIKENKPKPPKRLPQKARYRHISYNSVL